MNFFATDYPVCTGDAVKQGHADYCAANGHSVWMIDGVSQPTCPRCGVTK